MDTMQTRTMTAKSSTCACHYISSIPSASQLTPHTSSHSSVVTRRALTRPPSLALIPASSPATTPSNTTISTRTSSGPSLPPSAKMAGPGSRTKFLQDTSTSPGTGVRDCIPRTIKLNHKRVEEIGPRVEMLSSGNRLDEGWRGSRIA